MKRVAPLVLAAVWMAAGAAPVLAQDASSGAGTFDRMCRACHALEAGRHRTGPSLAGVVGRRAGAAEGYRYSEALKGSGLVWTADALASFLAGPATVVPGTRMMFKGLKDEAQIRALIAHLVETAR